MAELARGTLADRPWGLTLWALGARGLTGQITLYSEGRTYAIAFHGGAVVGAASPLALDSASRIAMQVNLISSSQVQDIARRLAAGDRDEIDIVIEAARLSPEHGSRLRRRVVAQRAARTFAVAAGDFIVSDEISIAAAPGSELDIRTIIYLGARTNLTDVRMDHELPMFGDWFALSAAAQAHLPQFGFAAEDQPVLELLGVGAALREIEMAQLQTDPRQVRAIIYSLASCGLLDTDPRSRGLPPSAAPATSRMRALNKPAPQVAAQQQQAPQPQRTPSGGLPTAPQPAANAPPWAAGRPARVTAAGIPSRPAPEFGATTPPPQKLTMRPANARPSAQQPAVEEPLDLGGDTLDLGGDPSDGLDGLDLAPPDPGTAPMAGANRRSGGGPAGGNRVTAPPPSGPLDLADSGQDVSFGRATPRPSARPVASRPPAPQGGTFDLEGDNPPAPGGVQAAKPPPWAAGGQRSQVTRTSSAGPGASQPIPKISASPFPPPKPPSGQLPRAPSNTMSSTPTAPIQRLAPSGAPASTPPRPSGFTPPTQRPSQLNNAAANAPRGGSNSFNPPTHRGQLDAPTMARPRKHTAPADHDAIVALIETRAKMLEDGVDHFELLGVKRDTPEHEIRKAYFGLARRLHPDRLAALGVADGQRTAHRVMAQINTAFSVLGHPRQRTEYLEMLNRGGASADRAAEDMAMRILDAEEAFRRGEHALRADQLPAAIRELQRAIDLNPDEPDYKATLAWAKFCASPDKLASTPVTRHDLEQAARKRPNSPTSRLYLGRMERMLGRDQDALRHFRAVLSIEPNNPDATSEIRIIESRLGNARSKR